MGSLVLESSNTFFANHSHTHPRASPSRAQQHLSRDSPFAHEYTPPSKRPRSPSSAGDPMSEPALRASGSSQIAHTSSRDRAPSQTARALAHTPHVAESASQPAIDTLVLQPSAPPTGQGSDVFSRNDDSSASASIDRRSAGRRKIKVRDLEHIQSFATQDMDRFSASRSPSRSRSRGSTADDGPQYEISEMKVEHIIEMVAGLLTKITTTNDRQHEHLHRNPPSIDASSHMNPQTSSVLAFHGKNVPSITILSYLSRINKYCPTSYEVFLSLLVYFDRMTERVNAGPMQSLREASGQAMDGTRSSSASSDSLGSDTMEGVTATTPSGTQQATPPASGSLEKTEREGVPGTPHSRPHQLESPSIPPAITLNPYSLSQFFVVDSFNIHRLVIAGVTCASKFFSDIFYTNSRYAKVGGLPLPELNHLELQFLLLNDFRLSVPVEEIEAYGTMLVEFYAREVVAQQRAAEAMQMRSLSESSSDSTSTVRPAP